MSQIEGDVCLDDLIKKDKEQFRMKKHKQIQKEREQKKVKNQQQQQRKQFKKQFKPKHEDRPHKPLWQNQPKADVKQSYAISVYGFVSDISIEDICNLVENRKIISVKTQLKRKDGKEINKNTDKKIEVVIVFSEKEEVDSFIKDYSEKILDGKHKLSFTFIDPRQAN